jgi:hypothetical protein
MVNKKGTALSLVRADVPAEKEEEFNRWYNEEHIPELLALPGYLSAARYAAVRGGPKYLACYELESPEAVNTEAAQRRRANPTEWGKRIDPNVIGTNFSVNLYQQIFPAEVSPDVAQSDMAPVLQIGCMDIPPEVEDEFNEWYNTIYVPNYEKVPGCIRGRRYRAVRGEPKYATVYEFEHEGVSQTSEWAAARDAHPQSARMRSLMELTPGSPAVYKKIFPL